MSYSSYQVNSAPTYMRGPYGAAWLRAHGIVKNYYANRVRQAVMMRFPEYASADALGAIGDERGIMQGIDAQLSSNETLAAYAARLKRAWDLWYWGGTAYGMLQAFLVQGFSPTLIQKSGTRWSLDMSGNLVITAGAPWSFPAPNLWNTFGVFFTTVPSSWTSVVKPPTPTSSPDTNEVNKLVRIINLWRPAYAICAGIYVVTSGAVWGFGSWGSPRTWGGSVVRFDVPV